LEVRGGPWGNQAIGGKRTILGEPGYWREEGDPWGARILEGRGRPWGTQAIGGKRGTLREPGYWREEGDPKIWTRV
jgi:hypothetical protein